MRSNNISETFSNGQYYNVDDTLFCNEGSDSCSTTMPAIA